MLLGQELLGEKLTDKMLIGERLLGEVLHDEMLPGEMLLAKSLPATNAAPSSATLLLVI